jgi:hypothetical protein
VPGARRVALVEPLLGLRHVRRRLAHLGDQLPGDARIDRDVPGGHRAYAGQDVLKLGILEQIARAARPRRLQIAGVIGHSGEHQDRRRGRLLGRPPGGVDAGDPRQLDFHDHHVGRESRMRRSAASPLAAAATSKPSRFKSARSPVADEAVLVHHQHPQGAPINAL